MRSDAFRAAVEAEDLAALTERWPTTSSSAALRLQAVRGPAGGLGDRWSGRRQVFEDFRYPEQVESDDVAVLIVPGRGSATASSTASTSCGSTPTAGRRADRDGAADERPARAGRGDGPEARRRGHRRRRDDHRPDSRRPDDRTGPSIVVRPAQLEDVDEIVVIGVRSCEGGATTAWFHRASSPDAAGLRTRIRERSPSGAVDRRRRLRRRHARPGSRSGPVATADASPCRRGDLGASTSIPDAWRRGSAASWSATRSRRLARAPFAEATLWTCRDDATVALLLRRHGIRDRRLPPSAARRAAARSEVRCRIALVPSM